MVSVSPLSRLHIYEKESVVLIWLLPAGGGRSQGIFTMEGLFLLFPDHAFWLLRWIECVYRHNVHNKRWPLAVHTLLGPVTKGLEENNKMPKKMGLSPSGIHEKRAENQSQRPACIPSKVEVWWPRDCCNHVPCIQIFFHTSLKLARNIYICTVGCICNGTDSPLLGRHIRPSNSESLYEDNGLFWPYNLPLGIGETSVAVSIRDLGKILHWMYEWVTVI